MEKDPVKRFVIGTTIVCVFFAYIISRLDFFPTHEELVFTKTIPNNNIVIKAYYVDSGATSNRTIQIRKYGNYPKYEILKNISGYNNVRDMYLISQKKLAVVVENKARKVNGILYEFPSDTFLVDY